MQGSLFTRDFLDEGITETRAWKAVEEETLAVFAARLSKIFDAFPVAGSPNEATTEQDLINKVLEALGWEHYLPKQTASPTGRTDEPDILLFPDAAAKARASRERSPVRRYLHGLAIVESKPWYEALDRGGKVVGHETPSTQMLRYLSRVEVASERRIQWGILTNGRHWRLYFQGARSRAEEFLELDLAVLAGIDDASPDLFSPAPEWRLHWLKVFFVAFRRDAFLPGPDDARTFHVAALEQSREWEARVARDLGAVVFDVVFPGLVKGLAASDRAAPNPVSREYLEEVRREALALLYRLLFVLYAEDRNLLPATDQRYDDYALKSVRHDIARRIDDKDVFSESQGRYYESLKSLFNAINEGDRSLGLPPYNGGLFDPKLYPLLQRVSLPDAAFAPAVDGLARREEGGQRKRINYRDLSVQQLGSIYERLLEYSVVIDDDGHIGIRPNLFARKVSGSFYTDEGLVRLILEHTVGPLVDERRAQFAKNAKALAKSPRPKAERLSQLKQFDAATRLLDLKVCDPAMGSGHFLVSLVDYLADRVLETLAESSEIVGWAEREAPYVSPLMDRIESIRSRILGAAEAESWVLDRSRLDDRHIVRRMILKRVIYGVDKNPMAVELAKLSLWLHTFTVGAPLSFLDHHLRVGDSLFGEWVYPVEKALHERGAVLIHSAVAQARNAAAGMARIEEITDADIAEVKESETKFAGVAEATAPLAGFLDFYHAHRWLARKGRESEAAVQALLDGSFGSPVRVAAGIEEPMRPKPEEPERLFKGDQAEQQEMLTRPYVDDRVFAVARSMLREARSLAAEESFLHWEVAFPGVWENWESKAPRGGFDAVIGNPPWDRIKLQEVEWFAGRKPEIARATRAADRKRMITALREANAPLWRDYEKASGRAEAAARVARTSGHYPKLSRGDINLYALFVERAHRLVKPDGVVGFVVPSGIASDKSASGFFSKIATDGRLAALLDFENKRVFFPDVDSRFKFCVFVAGGGSRRFDETTCAFFVHDVRELSEEGRVFPLSAKDFALLNPNTGTAPVFRSARDAAITTAIYRRVPVLVDRRSDPPRAAWPVRYVRMFDMTNDSRLFRRREELVAEGFYPVAGNRLKKRSIEYVPLYEGKMVQAFDHRAASVIINPENIYRPASPEPATLEQHRDLAWHPNPQFWVERENVDWPEGLEWAAAFKDVTSPTNVRTMIAAAVPFSAVGNTLPLLMSELLGRPNENASERECESPEEAIQIALKAYKTWAPLLLANLNSFAFDYVARQKVQGQHLNWYIVEQLPVVPAESYERRIGLVKVGDLVRQEVLKLTYTAHDMDAFARDMGHEGEPFIWDDEDRRHSRARLDALFFKLYGIGREDAAYILDTFPIVRRQDMDTFGRYLTRDLILAYMNTIEAGDPESRVVLQ